MKIGFRPIPAISDWGARPIITNRRELGRARQLPGPPERRTEQTETRQHHNPARRLGDAGSVQAECCIERPLMSDVGAGPKPVRLKIFIADPCLKIGARRGTGRGQPQEIPTESWTCGTKK